MGRMNFISKIIKAISIARRISKSHDLLAEGKVNLADKEIDELFEIYQKPLPDDLAFAGYVRYRAKRFGDAVLLYKKSLTLIEESTKLNQDTKNYLKVYIRKPMAVSLAMTQERSDVFDSLSQLEIVINLNNVPERIKSVHKISNLENSENVKLTT
ncbi:hypothetical protein [Thalassospira sp.]|uniref:hypothetical protein n=1 Tax=Thalassospira sp. TaxID=1912094 RepID=UPI001B1AB49D|nr:hypothetical protein [Thalassospira sp.]MBO6807684.1 hypothetical protein [Thalassospira sp.]MBO6840209.1 hypothetical protein [Thalassospira sp.]